MTGRSHHEGSPATRPRRPTRQTAAPARAVPRTPVPEGPALRVPVPDRAGIATLQRLAGNRATSQLIVAHRERTMQRTIENATFKDGLSATDKALVQSFFDAYEKAVQDAYQYAVSTPSLGALVDTDGRTKYWGELWSQFMLGGRPKLMAAAFGYVVESLASLGDYKPTPPAGCTVLTQVTSGGTRPDLVLRLKKGTSELAWIDLTASNSADHIFAKEGWDTKIGTYAEITYPSVTPATMSLMRQNHGNTGKVTPEEFKKRQQKAEAEYKAKKKTWGEMGKHYTRSARAKGFSRSDRAAFALQPELLRARIHTLLQGNFDTLIDEKMVPSILEAMDVNSSAWGYTTGFSISERAGEAWLVDNDPDWKAPPAATPSGPIRKKPRDRAEPYPTGGRPGPSRPGGGRQEERV